MRGCSVRSAKPGCAISAEMNGMEGGRHVLRQQIRNFKNGLRKTKTYLSVPNAKRRSKKSKAATT